MGYQLRFIEKYDIEAMARAVYSAGIHLADNRKEWLQLMMSMAGGGERLLDSFLLLASMAGRKFKERENRREFLKAVPKSCDTGLFFFIDLCRHLAQRLPRTCCLGRQLSEQKRLETK